MALVKKIMLANVPTLKKEAKILDAAKLLSHNESGCVVIVENNRPIGILTELDLDRKSTRLNSSHAELSRMPSSA